MKRRIHSFSTRCRALATLLPFLATSCGGKSAGPEQSPGSGSPMSDLVLVQNKDLPDGLDLRVSDGKQGRPAYDRATLAPAKKLADAEAAQLLARAAPIKADAADAQPFAFRAKSQPPPRTGKVITGEFPPPAASLLPPPPTTATGPLEVLRYMPEGKVPLAPELSVTFSKPMVAVTGGVDAARVQPVTLTPTPPGKWRWIGTRTILFDPASPASLVGARLPQATTYRVEIPAGTKSATGDALAKPVTFTFETPPPTLVASSPGTGQPQRLDVPMFVTFDQKIDQAAVLAHIKLTANGAAQAVRLLDAAELDKDKQIKSLVDATRQNEQDGRWVAFRSVTPLPTDAAINVEIGTGTPSAEGPNKTTTSQSFAFRTYPPLRIDRSECGWGGECHPNMPFQIVFNNPLDAERFADRQVAVTPDLPGVKLIPSGQVLTISGLTKARTTYTVKLTDLTDEFGQTLGRDTSVTFSVGDAVPTFFGPNGMVVLDPAAKQPRLDFFSTNYAHLKVQLYKVTPADYDAYAVFLQNRWNRDKPPALPGTQVFDQLVPTTKGANALVESSIDLMPAMSAAGLGHAIAVVEPSPWPHPGRPPQMVAWVQSTKLAVDAYVDADNLIAFATDLATGKPAAGVSVEIRPFGIRAATDAKGLATLPLAPAGDKGARQLVVRRGDDVAFVGDGSYYTDSQSWTKQVQPTSLAWYVIDDRKIYKPGEEVSLKGWLRLINQGKHGDIEGLGGAVTSVTYVVKDAQHNDIGKGVATVNAVGGFDTRFVLPKTPNLGYAHVEFTANDRMAGRYHHGFQIEEFRRPEFAVSAAASQGPFIVGGAGDVTVNAKYYSGGPLPGAQVTWNVSASQTNYTPPNRDDFVFGSWQPWWGYHGYDADGDRGYKPPKSWHLASKTDATGAHVLHLDFLSVKPAMPMSVQTTASVTDVNRQQWAASAALIVHPSTAYVGLKTKRPFVEQGTPFDLEVIGVDLDGKALPGAKIEVTAVRLDWEYKAGKYTQKEVDPQTCPVIAAKHQALGRGLSNDGVPCQFATKQGGTYQVTAVIADAQGRPNTTKLTFWVSGGEQPPERDVTQQAVQLIPDRKDYAPGTTAEILVQAPFYPAEAVVSWRRSGIVKTERITIDGPTKVITVPIVDAMTPNLHVQVDLVGVTARTNDKGEPDPALPRRPAYAVGSINLPVPPKHRTLKVVVTPAAAKLAPGESTKLTLEVRDAAGRPVADAEAAVLVVDEAILSLTGYQFPDPVTVFYGPRGPGARDHYLRQHVKLAKPDAAALAQTGRNAGVVGGSTPEAAAIARPSPSAAPPPPPGMKGRAEKADAKDGLLKEAQPNQPGTQAIAIRSNFNPLAAFSPAVKTDANGRATVDVTVPDNLTRYRVVAIAVAGDRQYGKGENAVTARLPLMVRPSPPRFLNFGDTFKLPIVVQNQTDSPMTVKVAVRSTNATITEGAGREVTVPANDRVEVQFPASAEMAGTARFQIVGTNGRNSDAAELALPVWTPATTEAFATYGVIDDGTSPGGTLKQPVALPGKVVTQFGGLEITTASTNLQSLTDAMLYLVHYPFECAEQRASRIMAIAALRDVLAAFKVKDMPSKAAMEASVAADIERLSQMQNSDGGFEYWERTDRSVPYLSVHVVNALARAKQKGFAVPPQILERAKAYLRDIERHYPHYYPKEVRWAISAYALYTRKQIGDLDIAKGQQLLREAGGVDKVTMETNGWLLGTFAGDRTAEPERKAIIQHAINKISETAGAANFTTAYGDGAYLLLASDRRVDAVMLEALILEQPTLDLIPKVVTGLLASRKGGRWLNTQENTFALVALDRYFQTYEKATPDFVARVWLGDDYAGDHAFKGRSTDYFQVNIPMREVATHDKQSLTIQKAGTGRLYYRVGMTYAPASLKLEAADYGFVVERTYEAVDDPQDVTRTPDGVWHVKAGARVRVKLSMVNENRRYHVALVDPLPAGLETLNPALAVTGPIPTDPTEQKRRGAYWWWYGPWYEHQNMRDERVEAFAAMVWEGVHKYTYVARATTPGNFVVPPPKAEEMYMPETFGRGASDRMIVE